jgi:hypothetical protein
MSKVRPHTIKHTNMTGISSPSLPAPDRGSIRTATSVGSGSRPVRSRAPIESSAPKDPETRVGAVPGMARVRRSRQ